MMGKFNRDVSIRKALRKRRIYRQYTFHLSNNPNDWDMYDNLHQYSKNKIHCSCPLCACKTNNKKRRKLHGNYLPSKNWKASDLRKIEKMDWSEDEE